MHDIFLAISVVIVCSAIMAWIASQGRQPIILAYFLCGIIIGPFGLKLIPDVSLLEDISHFGVALLLFLAGLVLHPDRLWKFFRVAAVATLAGCSLVALLVFAVCLGFGYNIMDALIIAIALMFSSTILVIKLLPTTTLHQRRMGSICIAILIAEDLIAVAALVFLGAEASTTRMHLLIALPITVLLLIAFAVAFEQFVLRKMMRKADRYNEVLVMLCLAWCVGMAALSKTVGVPYEVGAFVAGVAMARGKIALILSEQLKPLRDFFLMFFFFALGSAFDFTQIGNAWLPASLLAIMIVTVRPIWFRWLLQRVGEEPAFAKEMGLRLGPGSEFALIIVVAASTSGHLGTGAAQLIQLTTMLTMVASSYIVVIKCPTPIGSSKMQRD